MKNSVILKSFPNGISVILDDDMPFEELLGNVEAKFKESDKFLKDASVVISIEGRKLTGKEEHRILDAITENSHLNVLCLKGNDEEQNLKFTKIQEHMVQSKEGNFGQFYKGSLKGGQSLETENSIIILGDVARGCHVYSSKDIVILGALYGNAYAGAGGNSSHFIAALNMSPESLRIGDYAYKPKSNKSKGFFKKKIVNTQGTPMIAYTYRGEIILNTITKELLDDFTL